MPLYTVPYVPEDIEVYMGDAYHLLYEQEITSGCLNAEAVEYILKSHMHNYVSVRCEKRGATALLCVSRSGPEIQMIQVEVDESKQRQGNFASFVATLSELAQLHKRSLIITNVASDRLMSIMRKHADVYETQLGYASNFIVRAKSI